MLLGLYSGLRPDRYCWLLLLLLLLLEWQDLEEKRARFRWYLSGFVCVADRVGCFFCVLIPPCQFKLLVKGGGHGKTRRDDVCTRTLVVQVIG